MKRKIKIKTKLINNKMKDKIKQNMHIKTNLKGGGVSLIFIVGYLVNILWIIGKEGVPRFMECFQGSSNCMLNFL